jgi:hypothetical protein
MVSSKAIGGMTPAELKSWSDMTGIPLNVIKKMQETTQDPEKDYQISSFTDDYGNVTQVWTNKNDPTDRLTIDLGPIGNATSGGGSPTIQYIYNEKNTPAEVQADLVAVLTDPNFDMTLEQFQAMYGEFDRKYLEGLYKAYYGDKKEDEAGFSLIDSVTGGIKAGWDWLTGK